MTVFGEARKKHMQYKFVVEIDGVAHVGFQDCSELSAELEMAEYYEGGAVLPEKLPGRAKITDITLSRAACIGDRDLWNWFTQVVDMAAQTGAASPAHKRNLDIVQRARDDTVVRRWTVYGAWPKKFVAGAWDNKSNDPTAEQVVLAADYFELTYEAAA